MFFSVFLPWKDLSVLDSTGLSVSPAYIRSAYISLSMGNDIMIMFTITSSDSFFWVDIAGLGKYSMGGYG